MNRIAPKKRMPSGREPADRRRWRTLQVSIAEKPAAAIADDDDRADPGVERPHLDQAAIGGGHQQGDRIARRGQQRVVDDVAADLLVGDVGERAQHEIAGPADRLQDPEGAVLVLEKGLVAEAERIPAALARAARGAGSAIETALLVVAIRFPCAGSSTRKHQHRPVSGVGHVGGDRAAHILRRQRPIIGKIGADILDCTRIAGPNPRARRSNRRWSRAAARSRSAPD